MTTDTAPVSSTRQKHPARVFALGAGAVVVIMAVVLTLTIGNDPSADRRQSALFGKPAPSFSLPTLDGQRVSLASIAGKSVMVNFWNTWCVPCRAELPALKEFYDRHADDSDFVMIGIVRDDTTSAVRRYVRSEAMRWTIALDPGGAAALDFGTRGQPETYAIAPNGQIVGFQWGPSRVADLEAMLNTTRGQQ